MPGELSSPHWGLLSAATAVELVHADGWRDGYVHVSRRHAVGIDGCSVELLGTKGRVLQLSVVSAFAWARPLLVAVEGVEAASGGRSSDEGDDDDSWQLSVNGRLPLLGPFSRAELAAGAPVPPSYIDQPPPAPIFDDFSTGGGGSNSAQRSNSAQTPTAGAGGAPTVFKNTSFNVTSTTATLGVDFRLGDTHVLNGELPAAGGAISATCLNGTVRPYTISFVPIQLPPGAGLKQFDIKATIEAAGGGARLAASGVAYLCVGVGVCEGTNYELTWLDSDDGAAYLRAPYPPTCSQVHSSGACAAVGHCKWCTSADQLHALCFDQANTPPAGWHCGDSR